MKVTADMKASEADNVGTMLGNKQRFIQLKLIWNKFYKPKKIGKIVNKGNGFKVR